MATMTGRIERLCAQLTFGDRLDFEQRAARYGAAATLAQIITEVRAGTDPALLEGYLDALDEAFARHGIDNLTGASRAYRPPPGLGEHPVIRAWVCPAIRRCPRLIPVSRVTPPACALTGRDLALLEV
jgi:hypothetical protein